MKKKASKQGKRKAGSKKAHLISEADVRALESASEKLLSEISSIRRQIADSELALKQKLVKKIAQAALSATAAVPASFAIVYL